MTDLVDFLKTSFLNVRSPKRTKKFHKVLLDEVLNSNLAWAEYDWQYEYKLPVDGFSGTFEIDIAGFVNGELKVVILDKAINSSINKNIKNFANTSVGEAARLMFAPNLNLEKVLFISVLPRICPRFNKKGDVKGFDDVLKAKERTKINHVLEAQYSNKVQSIDLFYDIQDVKNKVTKKDFDAIIVENLDPLVIK